MNNKKELTTAIKYLNAALFNETEFPLQYQGDEEFVASGIRRFFYGIKVDKIDHYEVLFEFVKDKIIKGNIEDICNAVKFANSFITESFSKIMEDQEFKDILDLLVNKVFTAKGALLPIDRKKELLIRFLAGAYFYQIVLLHVEEKKFQYESNEILAFDLITKVTAYHHALKEGNLVENRKFIEHFSKFTKIGKEGYMSNEGNVLFLDIRGINVPLEKNRIYAQEPYNAQKNHIISGSDVPIILPKDLTLCGEEKEVQVRKPFTHRRTSCKNLFFNTNEGENNNNLLKEGDKGFNS